MDVELIEPVKDILVDDYNLHIGELQEKPFLISFGMVGTASCIAIDYDDGVIEMYGDSITCMSSAYASAANYIGQITNPLLVKHIYSMMGPYELLVHGFNALSSETTTLIFAVSTTDCSNPKVDIKDKKDNFWDPVKIQKSHRLNAIGISAIKCNYTLKNFKKWKVKQIDQNTGTVLSDIGIDDFHSSTSAELVLSPSFLNTGLYVVYYSIEMDPSEFPNDEVYYGETKTFIEIVKSDLVVRMFPGGITKVRLGSSTTYRISPADYSYDPDLQIGSIQV